MNFIIKKGGALGYYCFFCSPGPMTGIIKAVHGYHIILVEEITDYNVTEEDRSEADETLDFLTSNLNNS